MKIDILFQIAAVGVIVAVLNQLLTKSDRSEQALMVTIVGLVIVLLVVVGEIKTLFDTIKQAFSFV
ncbi:MAG: stage III sporulation protein AC [Ruminococcaceae bacterium]|nr:stage III sporulation protein AC [Oscillospiraceae bacterium]